MIRLLFILIVLATNQLHSQQSGIPSLDIVMPDSWFDNSNLDVLENLEKFEMEETQLKKLVNSNRGSLPIHIYMKYERSKHPGIIPTVQINLRQNPNRDFDFFKKSMEQSMLQMGGMLNNFSVIKEFHEIEIDSHKGIHFLASFDMKLPDGSTEKIRSWTYAIPVGNYFYQINFSDLGISSCRFHILFLIHQEALNQNREDYCEYLT